MRHHWDQSRFGATASISAIKSMKSKYDSSSSSSSTSFSSSSTLSPILLQYPKHAIHRNSMNSDAVNGPHRNRASSFSSSSSSSISSTSITNNYHNVFHTISTAILAFIFSSSFLLLSLQSSSFVDANNGAAAAAAAAAANFDDFTLDADIVKSMVRAFGRELSSAGTEQTCLGRIEANFQEHFSEIAWLEPNKMMEDIRTDVMHMLRWKEHAVERIANESERLSANHTFDKAIEVHYRSVKEFVPNSISGGGPEDSLETARFKAERGPNFDTTEIDLDASAVHVPVNVFDRAPDVVNDIKWSEALTPFFKNNIAFDPSLSWQFFCSAKGFLRLYPASRWRSPSSPTSHARRAAPESSDSVKSNHGKRDQDGADDHRDITAAAATDDNGEGGNGEEANGDDDDDDDDDDEAPDFFDCRMRRWYINAAASPKDIVILLDTSGSMTGIRKKIGEAVVANIFDTLTDDDYVAALQFAKTVEPIDRCFNRTMVQANRRNVETFKASLDVGTNDLVNFTAALIDAFNLLQTFNRSGLGSQCNQAIMIVTDGAPDTYEDIFRQYNWPNIPVRVFTYLIGRDSTAHNEVYWMACHNRGYYAHVANLDEVHDQVQQYIPVMSRPIVLSGERTLSWTPVYALNSETVLTQEVWDAKQSQENFERLRQTATAAARSKEENDDHLNDNNNNNNKDKGEAVARVTRDRREIVVKEAKEAEAVSQSQQQVQPEQHSLGDGTNANSKVVIEDKSKHQECKQSSQDGSSSSTIVRSTSEPKFDELSVPNRINEMRDESRRSGKNGEAQNRNRNRRSDPNRSNRYHSQYRHGDDRISKNTVPLYTTLSTPVFDTRNYTNITKRILIKNVYQDSEPETIRIANLLGVAGIDVPIREIVKLMPAFKIGVNSYVFIISNNGYVLHHPDLRPWFGEFLKPFYDSVDISEVELANRSTAAREWDPEIESIRDNMINQTHGWRKVAVKMHLDGMRRVVTRTNQYTHGMIDGTPFSLAIALPEPYGSYRLQSQIDLRMKRAYNFTAHFADDRWRVHPDWSYCSMPASRYHRTRGGGGGGRHSGANHNTPPDGSSFGAMLSTPEDVIRQFLSNDLEKQTFRWRTSSIRPQVYETSSCDKDLIQSLIFDAKLTDIPSELCNASPNLADEQRIKTFGIATTFVATRSGLTRFQDYRSPSEIREPFYDLHTRAIEEVYYQRAVDFYTHNRDAFVYSVDFDAGERFEGRATGSLASSSFLVTATHALMIGNGKQSAPVAVVGVQFRYATLHEFFLNTTAKFAVPCTHMDVDCFLIDNNAFVVLANHRVADVGRFFGLVDGDIMTQLTLDGIFRRVHLFDYQAICIDTVPADGSGSGSVARFAFSCFASAIRFVATLVFAYAESLYRFGVVGERMMNAYESSSPITPAAVRQDWGGGGGGRQRQSSTASSSTITATSSASPERTTVRACDKEFDLYEMMDFSNATRIQEIACGRNPSCTRKFVTQYVPHTNLLLVLIVNNPSCDCAKRTVSIEPHEVPYTAAQLCQHRLTEKNRKRPHTCHNYHPQEKDIRQCGAAASLTPLLPLTYFLGSSVAYCIFRTLMYSLHFVT